MRVEILRKPLKVYENISEPDRARIREAILDLRRDQHPLQSTRLIGSNFFRLRMGNWRIIYAVDHHKNLVLILKIERRSERTYKNI